ncbi:hypothetical protein AB0C96_10595 [Streptomyces sp. NPDC048506]|uniref:hypothetical protein n=1 Tax=Streptomyces sp. NPDC048506 TaxID=3155028 RepID=UPI003448BD52
MSAVFALPAAVRLPRTAAARRALLAGLFLVGFVALGFAFGPGAHADDRTGAQALSGAASSARATATAKESAEASTPDRAATRNGETDRMSGSEAAVERQGESTGAEITERTKAASDALAGAVRPAAEQAEPVTGAVVQPVSRVVREIGGTAGAVLPGRLPSGEHTGRPGDGAPHQHGATPGGALPAAPGAAATAAGAVAVQPAHCTEGPLLPAAGHVQATVYEQHPGEGRHGLPGQLPQGPAAPASHTAGDGHGPRGGDQHAAVPANSTSLRLLPGGVRTADGAPTRRRAEDILEFPG